MAILILNKIKQEILPRLKKYISSFQLAPGHRHFSGQLAQAPQDWGQEEALSQEAKI